MTFISNFLNHHQLPFCKEMANKLGNGFKFVATEPIPAERIAMGYEDLNNEYSFVVRSYENEKNHTYALRLGYESDLVIIGAAPDEFIQSRLSDDKLTFRYSERFFKIGIWRIIDPRVLKHIYLRHYRYRHHKLYMLCASAYTAGDYSLVNCYKDKSLKWGYFPEYITYDIQCLMNRKEANSKLIILWAGRMLKLKHPEKAIFVAEQLKKEKIDFELQMIGGGEQEELIRTLIDKRRLSSHVKLLGYKSPTDVRRFMEYANIFLFTSDYQEGWGAVLNEAMNSGCAVVASHAIGAAPFLIKHGKNGLIYKSDCFQSLYQNVRKVIDNTSLRCSMGTNAYYTITQTWNAENAIENLLKQYENICDGVNNQIEHGPGSVAKPIFQNRMYKASTKGF